MASPLNNDAFQGFMAEMDLVPENIMNFNNFLKEKRK